MNQYQEMYDPPPILMQVKSYVNTLRHDETRPSRHLIIALIMTMALFAFELFNFDTTRYALDSLIGNASFFSLSWAVILAIAFCSIDFAGLIRMFTPESDATERKEVHYLMGAWLLGATMNAIMTWWAVSLTLLDHQFGNEVLSREMLLRVVPVFVAVLVWLTRILFIGALSVTGEQLISYHRQRRQPSEPRRQAVQQTAAHRQPAVASQRPATIKERPAHHPSHRPAAAPRPGPAAAAVPASTLFTQQPQSVKDQVVTQEPLIQPTKPQRRNGPPRRGNRPKSAGGRSDKSFEARQRN